MFKLLAPLFALVVASVAVAQAPGDAQAQNGRHKLDGCQVIARIDNQAVLASDVLWEANMIIEDNRDRIPPEELDAVRQQLIESNLRSYIDTKLVFADFRRSARTADMDGIRRQLDEPFFNGGSSGNSPGSVPALMKALRVQSTADLEVRLAELGTSLADRKEAFVEKAIAQTWIQQKIDVDKPTYAQLAEYYNEHLSDYSYPTQARWEELTVQFSDPTSKQAARNKIVEAGNLAWAASQKQPGTTEPLFGEIAPKFSEGYNANDGGLYDWTTKGALVNAKIDAALFSLPVGALSPIIESNNAFHIVRVVERREAGNTPFADLQDDIRKEIMNKQFQVKMKDYLDELRRTTRIWTIYTGDTTAEAFLAPPNQIGPK